MELSGNSQKIGVIVSVERYQRDRLASAEFARSDAEMVGEAFATSLGISEQNLHWFLDADATSGSLQRDLKQLFEKLPADCQFYFYYSGHALYQRENWLTVFDTSPSALADSALSLEKDLFEPIALANCQQAVLFFDLRTHGLAIPAFQDFANGSQNRAVFVSCSPGESSFTSNKLGHGIWTWNLAKSLRGEFKESLTRDRVVTSQLLQETLLTKVKSFLRNETTLNAKQTPMAFQNSKTVLVARLLREPGQPVDTVSTLVPDFCRAYWQTEARQLFRKYSGFSKSKGHFEPTRITSIANQWAEELVAEEAQDEVGELYENCVNLLHNRRSEISRGLLSVDCDQFRFSINVSQDPQDPSRVLLVRKIELPSPLPHLPEDFDQVFPIAPDELVIPFTGNISYAELLKNFEDLESRLDATLREVEHGGVLELRFPSKVSMVVDFKKTQIRFYKSHVRGVLRLMRELAHDLNQLGIAHRLTLFRATPS